MQVFINSKPELDGKQGVAAALGTFDGLHLGHMALMEEMKKAAAKENLKTLAYTFTSIPSELFSKRRPALKLFTAEEKIRAFEKQGIDYLVMTDFDRRYASTPEREFILGLIKSYNIEYLVVGYNFTYGKDAKGTPETLIKEAAEYGFKAEVIEPVMFEGSPVSSSRIRETLLCGDVEKAAAMLGCNYSVAGTVVEGRRVGRNMGFPTVNLKYDKGKLLPKNGVYVTRIKVDGVYHEGITNIGRNPTVSEGSSLSLETHILGFHKAIYGEPVKVVFEKRLRDEIKFKNKEMLKEQIGRDVETAVKYFEI
jgi:riboflavin kinase/FMN adenylyltransferase